MWAEEASPAYAGRTALVAMFGLDGYAKSDLLIGVPRTTAPREAAVPQSSAAAP